jgi:hypothetical protein
MKTVPPSATGREAVKRIMQYSWIGLACSVAGLAIFRALGVVGFFYGLRVLLLMKYSDDTPKAGKTKSSVLGVTAMILGVVDIIIPQSILLTIIPH